ncbi:recombination protein U [Mycoplasma testudineum]|uniref:Holliday junction resolvase RecU n=1 Tax=Mycoplasma testudineum TaxID=244584 RepID=A0A4R6IB33_9MOLU|nr:Holliday junction resolvase RecU [Mycoplasma testudineum]OYD26577.1 Holliday junction resolvase RecU [Mycoplasma testudineum]TDO19410.1 recombination protein U [Mycoplasma testudineum]
MKNKGMYLEYIINKTIVHYVINEIAWFEKKMTPIKIGKDSEVHYLRSTTDFYGLYKGRYVSIEAKSFNGNTLKTSNIKKHQAKHLEMIAKHGGLAYYIIYSDSLDEYYLLKSSALYAANLKSYSTEWLKKNSRVLTLEFPGIIDFIKFIN